MSTRQRILISINASWNIYNFRRPLIHMLQEKGYEVITAAPEDAYSDRLREFSDYHPIAMSSASTSPFQDFLLFCRYLRLLRKLRPDVMLGYTIKPNIYGSFACRLLGIPIINNVSGLGTAFIRHNWVTTIAKTLYRQAFKSSAWVFFQNAEDRTLFIENRMVDAARTQIIPGSGIDLEHYQPQPAPARDHLRFLLIARMLWDKGISEYIEAARIVKHRYPNTVFQLLGPTGADNRTAIPLQTLQGWVEEGVVEYLGETDDVRDYIAASDAVVLPSYREGMSRALLEGMAMGRPLIATDVPGCRDTIDEGKSGLLCQLKDPEDLANKLIQFIEITPEKREEMGRASREKAEKEFDHNIVLEAYHSKIQALSPHN